MFLCIPLWFLFFFVFLFLLIRWSVSTSCMSSFDAVPISTGDPVFDGFCSSLMSFLTNLSHRLDELTV